MPILDLQKRARELGRIRIGQKGDRGQPQKLDRFRLTSSSKPLLDKVAQLYGGTVTEWTPSGGTPQWEVITDSTRLPIMVPPQPVSQWRETWSAGGCIHRCDGYTNVLTDEPCDQEDPNHINAKPTTRLNVVLRDVEGIGVWRLESKGFYAASELPDAAEFLARAGGYVNGWVSLEARTTKSIVNGRAQTRHFMVPIIEIDVTPAQLMAGEGRVQTPTLDGPVARPALEAGPSADPYDTVFDEVEGATTLEELAAIWDGAKTRRLVGPDSTASARREEFVEAWKTRAHAIKAATAPAPATTETVDAELVSDEDGDPDVVWQQVLKAAGEKGMSLPDVEADFEGRYGMSTASASAGELAAYLQVLQQSEQVPA